MSAIDGLPLKIYIKRVSGNETGVFCVVERDGVETEVRLDNI